MLWLWRRWEDTASIGPLAWEPLYAVDAALKRQKKKKKKEKKERKKEKKTRDEKVPEIENIQACARKKK